VLYPQNGDRIVTIDSVTSLHSVYTKQRLLRLTQQNDQLMKTALARQNLTFLVDTAVRTTPSPRTPDYSASDVLQISTIFGAKIQPNC